AGSTTPGGATPGSAAPGATAPAAGDTAPAASPAPSTLPAPPPDPAASAAAASVLPAPVPAASTPPAAAAPTASASLLPAPVLPSSPAGVGQDFDGIPVVGRMFVMKGGGAYFCTASVVSSPGRDLVLSAAHCLLGTDTRQVAFVPQYTRANPRPYGMFPVLRDSAGRSKVWIASRYRAEGAAKAATLDVAFAQVGPNDDGEEVEDVVGGNRLVTGATFNHAKVVLIGHPAPAPRPRVCVNKTTKFTSTDPGSPGSFLRIDCTGYPGGTSGGPFITRFDEDTATGDVVGVIGGWETGGPTADTSYSAYFGAEIRKLYQSAVAGVRVE
ncbi:trypsin-like peptidase domain-containing protein, partial [Streptomyces sp. NPDC029216]|uniref:trypsin-like peptidase domain-containing protein n=1 Tax=Streptomyces sp. NPDC029216 TaxID=3154701 RepID=UPI0033F2D8F9